MEIGLVAGSYWGWGGLRVDWDFMGLGGVEGDRWVPTDTPTW